MLSIKYIQCLFPVGGAKRIVPMLPEYGLHKLSDILIVLHNEYTEHEITPLAFIIRMEVIFTR
jgi:hypothetical protein